MPNVLAKSLLGLVAVLVAASVSSAQDPNQLFQDAVRLIRTNKRQEAIAKLQELLKADPSNEAAFKLWKETDQDVWTMMLLEKDEIGMITKHLLSLVQQGRKARSRDDAKIKELVATACSPEFDARTTASNKLVTEHGEFAVPALVERMSNADDDAAQNYAILALHRLGRSATLPLCEVLHSENATARRNAAAALAHIGDFRSAAALARVAKEDSNEGVRAAARSALTRLGGANANAVDLWLEDGRRYLAGGGVSDSDASEVVWSLDKAGKLVATDVPYAIYGLELAKKCAHEATLLDPLNEGAQTLLAQSSLAQASVIQDGAGTGDEALKAWAPKVPMLENMAMLTGPRILRSAVTTALERGQIQIAAASIAALGRAEDRANLESSPLVKALEHPDKRVSYAAALALTAATEGRPTPASEKVVAVLGSAITEEAVRVIHVIDSDPTAAKAAVETSGMKGRAVEASSSGGKAIDALRMFPIVDVIVINEKLSDVLAENVVGLIRKDPRMAKTKIIVVAADPEKAKGEWGEKIQGAIKGPLSSQNLQEAVAEALKDAPLDAVRASADAVAVAASQSLASLGASKVDLGPALGSLSAQLGRADNVAVPACKALGESGSAAQIGALADVTKNESASVELRVAAADAVGKILGRSAEAPANLIDPMLAVLGSAADAKVKAAVSTALGKGKFAPGERLKMVEAMRGMGAPAPAPEKTEPKS